MEYIEEINLAREAIRAYHQEDQIFNLALEEVFEDTSTGSTVVVLSYARLGEAVPDSPINQRSVDNFLPQWRKKAVRVGGTPRRVISIRETSQVEADVSKV